MTQIKWGIIGCGDVTEVKSGPAFNKAVDSSLVAVMRRNAQKAEDYAKRHDVPKWYTEASDLINDPDINAIYIATPPLNHEEYTIAALKAGKPVYVEKPMTLSEESALKMSQAAKETNVKLTVAHYRRGMTIFNKIKELIDTKAIGDIRFVNLQMLQPHESEMITKTEDNWRVNPEVSGGGLFHDLAPHQIDLMIYFFGEVEKASGISLNQGNFYPAEDLVSGEIMFKNNILFKGLWCFTVPKEETKDLCEIIGSEGKLSFPIFGHHYVLSKDGKDERVDFEKQPHIQQPMIQQVVDYFLDKRPNPCPAEEGVKVMRILDTFTKKN
jgi:predicted dehydrogenase